MPGFPCNFCAHRNPDGSKFCNECGSPLHLAPCAHCEAINNLSDERCNRCGASLSGDAAEPAPAVTATSGSDVLEPAAVAGGSVPIALADRMDDFPWAARPARSPVPAVERDEPTVSPIVAADVAESSDAMTSEPHAAARTYYDARKPRRAPSIVLAVLLVGVAGAVYWSSLSRVQSTEPGTVTVEAREHGAAAPGSPVPRAEPKSEASASTPEPVPTTAARQTQEPAGAQPVSPPVDAAANSAPAQPVGDAPSQTAERSKTADTSPAVGAPPGSGDAPAATAGRRKTADAPPAIESDAVDSTEARAAAKSAARRGDDARRRTPPYMRTREQAERDALATQRLIARDLGNAPPPKAAPGTGLPP